MLDPIEIDPNLDKELRDGEIFKIPFNYRSDYRVETGIILKNKDGYFCLVGVPTNPQWSELKKITVEDFEE